MKILKSLKKLSFALVLLISLLTLSSPNVFAEEIDSASEAIDTGAENLVPDQDPSPIQDKDQPDYSSIGGYTDGWRVASKTYTGESSGSWVDCIATLSPGTITCAKSVQVSNSYSGTLKASKYAVDTTVGFNITYSWTTTASYAAPATGSQKIQYRRTYDNYSVKQNYVRTYLITGNTTILDTKYVYPRKFSHFEFRLINY